MISSCLKLIGRLSLELKLKLDVDLALALDITSFLPTTYNLQPTICNLQHTIYTPPKLPSSSKQPS